MIKKSNIPDNQKIRFPVILIATLIIIIENYFVSSTWNGFSLNSLFINAVFIIFVLSLVNPILKKNLSLSSSELLLIYMMLAVATGAAGHDTLEMLTQTIGYPYWFATPENEWEDLFFKNLPEWLLVDNKKILEGFYTIQ